MGDVVLEDDVFTSDPTAGSSLAVFKLEATQASTWLIIHVEKKRHSERLARTNK